jgi:hypothetical protein
MDASIKDLPPDIPSGNTYYRTDSLVRFHGIAFGAGHRVCGTLPNFRSFASAVRPHRRASSPAWPHQTLRRAGNPIGPLGVRTPGGLLVLGRSQTGINVLFLTFWCSDPWLAKYILEDYVKKTNHKRFSITDFYAALFITSGFP